MLTAAALKYLSPPPSSVASEQLFSTATSLYANAKRNRLHMENASKLLFLMKSMPTIKFKYQFREKLADACGDITIVEDYGSDSNDDELL